MRSNLSHNHLFNISKYISICEITGLTVSLNTVDQEVHRGPPAPLDEFSVHHEVDIRYTHTHAHSCTGMFACRHSFHHAGVMQAFTYCFDGEHAVSRKVRVHQTSRSLPCLFKFWRQRSHQREAACLLKRCESSQLRCFYY